MRESSTDPVPGIVRITPNAMQVAQRSAHEYRWCADIFAFALDGEKDLGPAVQFCEFEEVGFCQNGIFAANLGGNMFSISSQVHAILSTKTPTAH